MTRNEATPNCYNIIRTINMSTVNLSMYDFLIQQFIVISYLQIENYLKNIGFDEKRLTPDRVGIGSLP